MKTSGVLLSSLVLLATMIIPAVPAAAASNSIGVNPRRDYVINPGERISETLNVTNLDKNEELNFKVEIIDFKPENETGTPSLMLKAANPTRWSLKPYLSIPGQYKVAGGKSIEVPFTIAIPKELGAGSYYSAIRYSAVNPDTGENISLSGSAVSLVFVRVPGETKSSLSLEAFGPFTPSEDKTTGTFATFYGATQPKYVSIRVRNNGNVAEQPAGSLLVKNMFGQQVKLIERINPGNNLVLIDQTRRFDVCLNEDKKEVKNPDTGSMVEEVNCNSPKLLPGYYKAQMGFTYGDNGNGTQELKATAGFWYLPAWFVVAVIGLLIAIVFAVRKLIHAFKNRGKPTYGSRRR